MLNTTKKKRKLKSFHGCVCALCGAELSTKKATVDHIIPEAFGGQLTLENTRVLCKPCNKSRMHFFEPYVWDDLMTEFHRKLFLKKIKSHLHNIGVRSDADKEVLRLTVNSSGSDVIQTLQRSVLKWPK